MRIFKGILTLFSTFIAAAIVLTSCNKKAEEGPVFIVKGNIENGADKSISIYNIAEGGAKEISTAKLDGNGNFEFRVTSPEHFDFYLLNVEECGTIVFIADSTETITINSDAKNLVQDYTIDGNEENQRIKELQVLRDALEKQVSIMAKE